MFVAVDGQLAGLAGRRRSDQGDRRPRPFAALHELGLRVIMLTGDNEQTAEAVAGKLGIDEFEAGVTPEEKHDHVRR